MPNVPNYSLRGSYERACARSSAADPKRRHTPSPDRSFEREHGQSFAPRLSAYEHEGYPGRDGHDDEYSEEPLLDQLGYPPRDDMEHGSGTYTHDTRDIKGIVIEVDGASAASFVRVRSVEGDSNNSTTLTLRASVLVSNPLLVERTRVRTSRDGNIFMMHIDVPKQYLFYKCVRTEIELILPRTSPALHVLRLELTNGDVVIEPSAIHAQIKNFDMYAQNARAALEALNATAAAVGVHRGSLNATIWQPELVHMNVAQGPVTISIPAYGPSQPTVRAESTDGRVSVRMGHGFTGWFVASAYRAVAAVRTALANRMSLHTTAQQLKTGWCGSSAGEGRIEADSMKNSVEVSFE
ncbi:hypothetical protein SYNPS1DRAFT_28861 [Syncephalis pseudoplumigaleata]|uniref:Uncharacterized protein n=1 Tax=Syncephalis pseudoplumigaleata TaxID=1712513 RepID=A0A4P9YZ61_9FUNG|nr:hypothetical protein SYNPS1DRAFT_28861 [Syncephalis pseudoplumigaleata]|eukprot:RKP25406.1 hypothetical protein SYNPS1DRAFT_28861 [Syncephalis pseudoplumigaleata]